VFSSGNCEKLVGDCGLVERFVQANCMRVRHGGIGITMDGVSPRRHKGHKVFTFSNRRIL
jgi:hypothetical protein